MKWAPIQDSNSQTCVKRPSPPIGSHFIWSVNPRIFSCSSRSNRLVQKNAFGGAAPQTAADTYTFLITHLLPVGLKGLVAAAMLAAAMQTCSAALNSTATLVAYDLFKRHRPNLSDHRLVMIGKVTTVAGTALAIVASPLFGV